MATFKENIRKIARTAELEAKIKAKDLPINRGPWDGARGIADAVMPDVCALFYSTNPNSFDIGDLLAGTAGPTLADKCSRLDTITGLTDFDTSEAIDSLGADVFLIIQVDGNFD